LNKKQREHLGQLLPWINSLQIGPTVRSDEKLIEGSVIENERPPDAEK
jgi:hypothetical protein